MRQARRSALTLLLALTAAAACVTLPPSSPPAPQPTPPTVATVACILLDLEHHGIPDASCRVDDSAGATFAGVTNHDGYVAFDNVHVGKVHVEAEAPEFYPYSSSPDDYTISGNADFRITLAPRPPPFTPLPGLRVRGQFLEQDTGASWTVIEASDFFLFGRYLDGEDIRPVLEQRRDAGFNTVRVWTRMQLAQYGIGDLTLAQHPDLYERLPAFLRLCATHGLYVELTAYTGREDFDPQHWDRLTAAVRGETNALLSLVNEVDQAGNRIDLTPYRQPEGILSSRGSHGSEQWPPEPRWDYAELHTNGAFEEQRKVGHNAMEMWGGPSLTGETSRFPDVGMWRYRGEPREQWVARVQQLAFDTGAGCALLAAGCTFHSINGKNSTIWDAEAEAVAREWARGMQSIPLACQRGRYRHGQREIDDEKAGGYLRVYRRVGVDDDVCVARIRP